MMKLMINSEMRTSPTTSLLNSSNLSTVLKLSVIESLKSAKLERQDSPMPLSGIESHPKKMKNSLNLLLLKLILWENSTS
jgi:hypothetical protein